MNILLDANVLLRLADPSSKTHAIAARAVLTLRSQGESPILVPQCIYEFWVVATRPIANNGLGLSSVECARDVANLKASFPFLDDKPTLFTEWEAIVSAFTCHGKLAHDARYVAAMRTHGLTHLLTFNVSDFSRYPGLTILDPNMIAASGPPGKTR
jgi:predicted nucleic acid-binding protein